MLIVLEQFRNSKTFINGVIFARNNSSPFESGFIVAAFENKPCSPLFIHFDWNKKRIALLSTLIVHSYCDSTRQCFLTIEIAIELAVQRESMGPDPFDLPPFGKLFSSAGYKNSGECQACRFERPILVVFIDGFNFSTYYFCKIGDFTV